MLEKVFPITSAINLQHVLANTISNGNTTIRRKRKVDVPHSNGHSLRDHSHIKHHHLAHNLYSNSRVCFVSYVCWNAIVWSRNPVYLTGSQADIRIRLFTYGISKPRFLKIKENTLYI